MVKTTQKKNKRPTWFRISVQSETPKVSVPSLSKIRKWAKTALSPHLSRGELNICLVDKRRSRTLNKRYRRKDKPTNVLSFRADFPGRETFKVPLLGELVICSAIVNREAKAQDKTPDAHWAHIIIHGTLHILGYDHEQTDEARRMEGKEIKLLKQLDYRNPYRKLAHE